MRKRPVDERFWEKVDRGEPGDCWPWTASRDPSSGYGRLAIQSRPVGAHRISWELANGTIPAGLHVLHRCDNPPCVNPAHLFIGTAKENHEDMVKKGRQPWDADAVKTRDAAKKLIRLPADMGPMITEEAEKAGVSENQWMLAVLAAAVGYRLPEK